MIGARSPPRAALWTLAAHGAFLLYFGPNSRHDVVGAAPEEEVEAVRRAEAELARS